MAERVKLVYFSWVRERIGVTEETLELPESVRTGADLMEWLKARGDTILSPPVPLVVDGRSKQREMVFRDPDGVMINLIEWDPDEPRRPELS